MIRLKDVEMEYDNGTRAIKGISLTIEDGEFVFLVGPSGSGKSTIIKLLTGEVEPCAGRIMINGFSVSNISEKQIPLMRRTLGVIFQDFRLIEKKTVYDNLAFVMRAVGASPKEIRKRIPYVLELVGLAEKAGSYPTELSGGEQQRVAIARALVNNPNTIIADEPTGNLDPERSLELMSLLVKINELGTTWWTASASGWSPSIPATSSTTAWAAMWEDASMAKHHDFRYFFHEGLSNMFSHGFMSFAAIGITVACLLIMGTFTLVAVNANELLKNLEQENEILAYVDDSYTDAQARALQSRLEAIPNVASVTFISKEEAMEDFKAQYPDEELFQDLDPEILEDRYAIKLVDLEEQSETVEAVQALTGISDVSHYEEIAGGFVTVRNVATVVCVALIAILFVVSVFIISNTIKLTTFDRREEIAIMRMVGATNGFIRWPFVYEGFMLGLLGAVIAFFLQWALYAAVARGVDSNDTLQLIRVLPFSELWAPVAAVFALAGIIIGVGGSLSAIRRFLQV